MTGRVPHMLYSKEQIKEFLGAGDTDLRKMIQDGAPIRRTNRGYMRAEGWALWDFYDEWLKKQEEGEGKAPH